MGRSTPGALGFAVRSAALPFVLGARWLSRREPLAAEVPQAGSGLELMAKVLADEVFLASELLTGKLITGIDRRRVRLELATALGLYREEGWLDAPETYHLTPPPIAHSMITHTRWFGFDLQHLRYESGFAPRPYEPGRDRWLGYDANREAHARLLVHAGPPRPWIVCTPGFRMGSLAIDLFGFRVRWLHQQLGLNVAIPVLPFHGPRKVGRRGGDGFLTGDLLDLIHAQAQAVWDIRRLVGWLRESGAPSVGVYGLSLGGYTVGLLSALEDDLDCVIAGIPASDWAELVVAHAPRSVVRISERLGFPWSEVRQLLRVVSPLAMPARVPSERCFVFGGTSDRLAPPEQAHRLWEHWGRCRIRWYDGSHVSFLWERSVTELVEEALRTTRMIA